MMQRALMLFKQISFLKNSSNEYEDDIPQMNLFMCTYWKSLNQKKSMSITESIMPELQREIGIYLLQIRQNLPEVNIYRDPLVTKEMLGEEVEDNDDYRDDGVLEIKEDEEENYYLQVCMQIL